MTPRKVLILESGFLQDDGVYSLISNLKDVEVIATKLTSLRGLIQTIDEIRPHVLVLLDDADLIEVAPAVLPSLRKNSIRRIIVIHWEENVIEVYDRQKVEIKELTDFLAML